MRILVISDIHANLQALNAVLEDAGQTDQIWCLGDLVGYGPNPNECVETILQLPNTNCILGNHDAASVKELDLGAFNFEARQSAFWTDRVLSENNRSRIKGLPKRLTIGEFTLVHGTPRNPIWEYLLDQTTAAVNFTCFDTPFCLVGHTHVPGLYVMSDDHTDVQWFPAKYQEAFTLDKTKRAFLNPGSVGQPRDHDPRASYALISLTNDEIIWEFHRVSYKISAVQDQIRNIGLPARHADRLAQGW